MRVELRKEFTDVLPIPKLSNGRQVLSVYCATRLRWNAVLRSGKPSEACPEPTTSGRCRLKVALEMFHERL